MKLIRYPDEVLSADTEAFFQAFFKEQERLASAGFCVCGCGWQDFDLIDAEGYYLCGNCKKRLSLMGKPVKLMGAPA